jgi:large subunit ribosomal protein L21
MTIAVIKTGGKQYKVKPNQQLKIEKIAGKTGDKVKFEALLVAADDAKTFDLGTPKTAKKVEAEILEQGRARKVNVIKYKRKTRYRRKQGHRQPYTKVKILSVGGAKATATATKKPSASASTSAKASVDKKATAKKPAIKKSAAKKTTTKKTIKK